MWWEALSSLPGVSPPASFDPILLKHSIKTVFLECEKANVQNETAQQSSVN